LIPAVELIASFLASQFFHLYISSQLNSYKHTMLFGMNTLHKYVGVCGGFLKVAIKTKCTSE